MMEAQNWGGNLASLDFNSVEHDCQKCDTYHSYVLAEDTRQQHGL